MNINYMTKEIVTDLKAFIIGIRSDEPYFRNGKAKELDLYSKNKDNMKSKRY